MCMHIDGACMACACVYVEVHSQHHSCEHLRQVMWLQPPFFSVAAEQRGHGLVCSLTHAELSTSWRILSPYLLRSTSLPASSAALQRIDRLAQGARPCQVCWHSAQKLN